jgi:hypothetical protein
MNADLLALEAANKRLEAVRAYRGTEQHTHLVGLLELLKTSYMHDLIEVTPSELQLKQGALRQVIALLDAIDGPLASVPKV